MWRLWESRGVLSAQTSSTRVREAVHLPLQCQQSYTTSETLGRILFCLFQTSCGDYQPLAFFDSQLHPSSLCLHRYMVVCPCLHLLFSSSFLNIIFILFLYFCLHWAFIAVHGLPVVGCAGFSWQWLLLRSMDSRCTGFNSCSARV